MVDHKQRITDQTRRWARHEGVGEVGTTSSFANMEALLKREYFGRFVIELIQNARDAWYANGRPRSERGVVRVLLHGDPPVLTFCNQGVPLDSEGLIKHIAQFGESSKKAGAGIGHKGIGLKSVLEVTRCPEIFSRPGQQGPFELCVKFDPRRTEEVIDDVNWPRTWRELVKECDPEELRDKDQRLPVLRFPHWVDNPPPEVQTESVLDSIGFNTLVRLPYDSDFDERLGLKKTEWIKRVRSAIGGVSDEIVMLLDAFERVELEDHLAGSISSIRMNSRELRSLHGGGSVRLIELHRSDVLSSSWLLYERSVKRSVNKLGSEALAGEIVVGVKVERGNGIWRPVLPTAQARCFHLFFPTRIETHLPFLLHAYFEVDAGRTRFAPDSEDRNRNLLVSDPSDPSDLKGLVVDCVADLVNAKDIDARPLASLFGEAAGEPEDPLAHEFREAVLKSLDESKWVPVRGGNSPAAPMNLLVVERADLAALLPEAFPPGYLADRTGLFHPIQDLAEDDLARGFLARRSGRSLLGEDGVLEVLLRPGALRIWDPVPELTDSGFHALMLVLGIAAVNDSDEFRQLAGSLRGDPAATILPAVCGIAEDEGPQRRFLPPPSLERGVGTAVFARISEAGSRRSDTTGADQGGASSASAELGVPECLNMAFLPTDTLTPELLTGTASMLGIRPFGTDAVLDQLPIRDWSQAEAPAVARFAWRLLLRESVSTYGIKEALDARQDFDPVKWFWCYDPRLVEDADGRRKLLRRRALAHVPLPARDGVWRPAGKLCFGSDWARRVPLNPDDRLVSDAFHARSAAYDDLETLADGPHWFVSDPAKAAAALPLSKKDLHWLRAEILAAFRLTGEPQVLDEVKDDDATRLHQELLHIFMIRLGVWEVPPVDAVLNDLRPEASREDPWDGQNIPDRAAWKADLDKRRPEWFGVGYRHAHVRIAADYRLIWPMSRFQETSEATLAHARALTRGAKLYLLLLRSRLFCHRCSYHIHRHWSRHDGPGNSFLHWQLSHAAWVPVTIDARSEAARVPSATWWMNDPPDKPAYIATNPRRFLPLVRRGVGDELLCTVGGHVLDKAAPEEIKGLLLQLREDFENKTLPVSVETGAGRQAFVGLHRLLYGRIARSAATEQAQAILEEVGVLAYEGAHIVFKPRRGVVYNDGTYGSFKRHFVGKVPFAPLNVGEDDIAQALGLGFFEVRCTMAPFESSEAHTETVGDFIEERLAEVMALLTQMPLGRRLLGIDSDEFRIRSQRLRDLAVLCVPDVVLELSVVLPDREPITTTIGQGPNHDIFLDWRPRRSAVLYHDFQGPNWFDPLRRRLGEVVARLVENDAFRDTLSLFFQTDEDARESFLAERGVAASTLEEVYKALGRAGHFEKKLAERWWKAVLGSVGAGAYGLPDPPDVDEVKRRLAEAGWGDDEARETLIEAGGGDEVRGDTTSGGALDVLEANGVRLEDVNSRLRNDGDAGLRIHVAEDQLRSWRSEHGGKVAFVLEKRGKDVEEAKACVRAWRVPENQKYRVRVDAAEVLAGVVADLGKVGIEIAPADLTSERVDTVLAQATDVPLDEWDRSWRGIFSPEEQQKLLRQRALAWRDAAEIPVVTLVTQPGDLPHRLRAARDLYREHVRGDLSQPTYIRVAVQDFLQNHDALTAGREILSCLPNTDSLDLPNREALKAAIPEALAMHFAEVSTVLRKRGRERLDAIRKNMDQLKAMGVKPKPFSGPRIQQRPPRGASAEGEREKVRVGKVGKRDLQRIGALGESWALAAVMRPLEDLLSENRDSFDIVVQSLRDLLVGYWDGPAVDALVPHADRALDRSIAVDDCLEALADFLHLSKVSDCFGVDLLGWLPPCEGAPPAALALEVKSATSRSFLASDHEWEAAARLDEKYAFLVVLRQGREVRGMDLLPQPEVLRERKLLLREPDTWKVTYSPSRPVVDEDDQTGNA